MTLSQEDKARLNETFLDQLQPDSPAAKQAAEAVSQYMRGMMNPVGDKELRLMRELVAATGLNENEFRFERYPDEGNGESVTRIVDAESRLNICILRQASDEGRTLEYSVEWPSIHDDGEFCDKATATLEEAFVLFEFVKRILDDIRKAQRELF